jgi:FlaA1/EpsC-like NDP-sugar epimerase
VTVTDPEMTWFVMPTGQAVGLVMDAATTLSGGEVFVLKMPSIRIGDLAAVMIDELADDPDAIGVEAIVFFSITGTRIMNKNEKIIMILSPLKGGAVRRIQAYQLF